MPTLCSVSSMIPSSQFRHVVKGELKSFIPARDEGDRGAFTPHPCLTIEA